MGKTAGLQLIAGEAREVLLGSTRSWSSITISALAMIRALANGTGPLTFSHVELEG